MAVVDDRPEIRIGLPRYPDLPLRLEDARLLGDRILFRVRSRAFEGPVSGSLKLIGENRLVMEQIVSPDPKSPRCFCLCGDFLVLPYAVLVRNPPRGWLMRQSARRNTRLAREAYKRGRDAVFERLARIL